VLALPVLVASKSTTKEQGANWRVVPCAYLHFHHRNEIFDGRPGVGAGGGVSSWRREGLPFLLGA
jgi:hypothetical protein